MGSHFYTLCSSPLNAITLPDAARSEASIPMNARFYSFCYPAFGAATATDEEIAARCTERGLAHGPHSALPSHAIQCPAPTDGEAQCPPTHAIQ
jgi:hypothetical protein